MLYWIMKTFRGGSWSYEKKLLRLALHNHRVMTRKSEKIGMRLIKL